MFSSAKKGLFVCVFLYLFIYFFNKQESTDVSVSSWPVSTQSWERGGSESIICVSVGGVLVSATRAFMSM